MARLKRHSILFPKLNECKHFHYENIQFSEIRVQLIKEEKCLTNDSFIIYFLIGVTISETQDEWTIRRNLEDFISLDFQLHECVLQRNYSQLENLQKLKQINNTQDILSSYLTRFSQISSNLGINCVSILNWFECDNHFKHFINEESEVNRRGICAAFVIKKYSSEIKEILNLEIGELVSILEINKERMKGKKGFQVGFFPSECVQLIDEKISTNFSSIFQLKDENNCQEIEEKIPKIFIKKTPIVLRKHAKNGKISAFFRQFLSQNSTTNERNCLKSEGILKERVFGCDLSEYLFNTSQEIPLVLKICTKFIESKGLLDGIYRLSGISSNIHKLRQLFDEEIVPDLENDMNIISDIHCVSSLLKMYFRELPNPLLTFQLYDSFVECIRNREIDYRLQSIRQLIRQLPPPHYRTLHALIHHLHKVSLSASLTGMTPKNLAIVWAPNLLRSKQMMTTSMNMDFIGGDLAALQVIGIQAVLTEYLIQNCQQIFTENSSIKENKQLLNKLELKSNELLENYIEVGPEVLPKYHTIITSTKTHQNNNNKSFNNLFQKLFQTKQQKENKKGFKRRFSEKKHKEFEEKKEIKEEINGKKTFIRSKSFESFFNKNNDKKIVLNFRINFAKIETLFESSEVLEQFNDNNNSENTISLWTTNDALMKCSAIVTTTARHDTYDTSLLIRTTPFIRNDSSQVKQKFETNSNKTLFQTSRERIERIKAERRQQLRQQFTTKPVTPVPIPTPTPRKTVTASKWRQIAPKVDTRRSQVTPIPTPRRRYSCDGIQTTKTTTATETTTTTTTPVITITTLKTSSKSKRNNWNTTATQIFESNKR